MTDSVPLYAFYPDMLLLYWQFALDHFHAEKSSQAVSHDPTLLILFCIHNSIDRSSTVLVKKEPVTITEPPLCFIVWITMMPKMASWQPPFY